MAKYERACEACGRAFVAKSPKARFCSGGCQHWAWSHPGEPRPMSLVCPMCGTTFARSGNGRQKFCSKLCSDIACGKRKIGPRGGVIVCVVCRERRAVYNPTKDKACRRCQREYKRRQGAAWRLANPWLKAAQDRRHNATANRKEYERRREYHRKLARRLRQKACERCGATFNGRGTRCEQCRRPLPVIANVVYGRTRVLVTDRPVARTFIAGTCQRCGESYVDRVWNGPWAPRYCSPRCRKRAGRKRYKDEGYGFNVNSTLRQAIFRRDRWICHLCGDSTDPDAEVPDPLAPTIDHVEASANGGIDTFGNVYTAHFICNSRKRDLTVEEYRARYGWQRPRSEGSRPPAPV